MAFADLCTWDMSVQSIDDTGTGARMGKQDTITTIAAGPIPCVIHDAKLVDVLAFARINERIDCRVQFMGPITVTGSPIRLDTTHRITATHRTTGIVRALKVKAEKIPVAASMPHVAHCEEQPR